MKDLIWDNTLSVQVQEIDDDHSKLVNLFNLLTHAINDNESSAYIEAILDELICCTIWHFRHEERLMIKYSFNGFMEHKKEHQELVDSAMELQQKFLKEGRSLSIDDIEYLEHWLTGHILGSDMELGQFLGEAM